jgi:uncharacterized membrane protein
MLLLVALLLGIVAGLRALTAPAALSWAVWLGRLDLHGTWVAFLGYRYTPWILSALALGELVTDQLPQTPSRKVPIQFGARIASGAFCGGVVGQAAGSWFTGAVAGAVGAVIGTLGGAALRERLASGFRRDRPAALIEDAIDIGGALLVAGVLV